MTKIVGSRDLGHGHFQGKLLCARSALAIQSRVFKFEVSSSSSFGDIDAAVVNMTLNDL